MSGHHNKFYILQHKKKCDRKCQTEKTSYTVNVLSFMSVHNCCLIAEITSHTTRLLLTESKCPPWFKEKHVESCRKASAERRLQSLVPTVAETVSYAGMFREFKLKKVYYIFLTAHLVSADSAERGWGGRHLKKIGIVFILRIAWCRQRKKTTIQRRL